MKLALAKMGQFHWTWHDVASQLINWWWLATGGVFAVATVLWLYMLKHWPFSVVYPLSSLAYVFGMIAAMAVFKEQIPLARWAGILLIMAGSVLIVK